MDEQPEWTSTVTALLLLAANHCVNLLAGAINNTPGMGSSLSEGHFSYQVCVCVLCEVPVRCCMRPQHNPAMSLMPVRCQRWLAMNALLPLQSQQPC